jgi:hypothetical protein
MAVVELVWVYVVSEELVFEELMEELTGTEVSEVGMAEELVEELAGTEVSF